MMRLRSILPVVLSLALALAGLAAPGGHAAAGGLAVTICTGDGPRSLVLGPDGHPMPPAAAAAHCPACILPGAAPLPGPAALPRRPARARRLAAPPAPPPVPARPRRRPRCRAPPAPTA